MSRARGMSFNICRGTLGSLAMFTAIRNCLVAREQLSARSTPRLILEIDIRQRLLVVVADDEAGGAFLDRPGRREAAGRGRRRYLFPLTCSTASIACLSSSLLRSGSFGER